MDACSFRYVRVRACTSDTRGVLHTVTGLLVWAMHAPCTWAMQRTQCMHAGVYASHACVYAVCMQRTRSAHAAHMQCVAHVHGASCGRAGRREAEHDVPGCMSRRCLEAELRCTRL